MSWGEQVYFQWDDDEIRFVGPHLKKYVCFPSPDRLIEKPADSKVFIWISDRSFFLFLEFQVRFRHRYLLASVDTIAGMVL